MIVIGSLSKLAFHGAKPRTFRSAPTRLTYSRNLH
jgi:hypothetical protein